MQHDFRGKFNRCVLVVTNQSPAGRSVTSGTARWASAIADQGVTTSDAH
jgi:hypothetical protein